MIRLKNILKENIFELDIKTIKSDTQKKKFIEIGYVTEYPDVTLFYIRHEYSKTNNYNLIKSNKLMDAFIKDLDAKLKSEELRVFLKEYAASEPKMAAVIVQPKNYKIV